MKRLALLFSGAAMLLAGCSKEGAEEVGGGSAAGDGIRFEMGIGAVTRVTTDGASYHSEWLKDDLVGIYATKSGTPLAASGNYIDNAVLRYDGTGWTYTVDEIYYPLDGAGLDFYAYYPYDRDLANPLEINTAVLTIQSAQEDFNASEFLSAVAKEQKAQTVRLTFTHAMALVEVRPDRVAPVPAFREDAFSVTLKGVYIGGAFDWETQAVEATGDNTTDVRMCRVDTGDEDEWIFRALVPAQAKAAGALLRFEQFSAALPTLAEINMTYNSGAADFVGGDAAAWAISVDYGLNEDHKYKVGDYWPYKGTPLGVVYWLDPTADGYEANGGGTDIATGLHGKIVSMDEENTENNEEYGVAWGPDEETTATYTTNGLENMVSVKNYIGTNGNDHTWSDFPAFAWCDQKNGASGATTYASGLKGVWYLPSRDELGNYAAESLYESFDNYGKDNFNALLTGAGGAALETSNRSYYWSSTGAFDNYAWYVTFYDGNAADSFKFEQARVRAVLAF